VLSTYDVAPTRSELEEAFLRLCDDHALPRPQTNTHIEGFEVDFAWPAERLIVEVDGYAFHRSPTAFETDRERDVILALAGWRVLRFTYAQVTRRARWVARAIAASAVPQPVGLPN
jgi:very-short-patch-repair endonuclease